MYNFSNGNSFEEILARLLANVDNGLDKRQGSIIYDALAPAAAELAQCYIALDVYSDQTYLPNATGENLDNRVADYGLTRVPATYAEVTIITYNTSQVLMDVDIGSRFSTPNEYGGYNFTITSKTSTGVFKAVCETAGSAGNAYTGELLPLVSINNLGNAIITEITKPGEDEETDEELRARAISKINQEAFAGNKAAYKQLLESMDGIEVCKIFPVWNGGGTVKIAILTSNYTIPNAAFVNTIQEIVDPTNNSGEGIGLAPIGHEVTIVAPTEQQIDISATLTLATGYTVPQVRDAVEEEIGKYILEVQKSWADKDSITIFISKIAAAILNVSQVENVSTIKINNTAADLTINITASNIKFPILNEVTLNAS